MKKAAAIILAMLLTASLCACGEQNTINIDPAVTPNTVTNLVPDPEPQPSAEELLAGDWYAQQHGIIITLSFDTEGKYSISMSSSQQKTGEGSWALKDKLIYLDGSDVADFSVLSDQLLWLDSGIVFNREMPKVYSPGNAVQAGKDDFDGYWTVKYVKIGDTYVSAGILDDNTDVYIEGTNVALGGAMFGDALAKFTFEDGALVLRFGEEAESKAIIIELLDDGNMSLTLKTDDPSVLILEKSTDKH